MDIGTVLDWFILALVAGLGVEIKRLRTEIRNLKDELSQNNAS